MVWGGRMYVLKEDRAGQGRLTVVVCPQSGEVTPQVDTPKPKSRPWGGVPHRRNGGDRLGAPGQWQGLLPSSVWT